MPRRPLPRRKLTVERLQRRVRRAKRQGIVYADLDELVRDEEEEERGIPVSARRERRKKRLAVTGAAGRVGKELVPHLLEDFDVIAIVKELQHAHHLMEAMRHAMEHHRSHSLKIVRDDLSDEEKLTAMLSRVSQVIHLAATIDYNAPLGEMVEKNVRPTAVVANACRRANVERLIVSSSTSVFRKPAYLPIDERHPLTPGNPYGKSKALSEEVVRMSGVPYVIARFPIIYGEGFQEGFGDVINATAAGKMRRIGNGKNRISFIHIDDVVRAFGTILSHREVRNQDFIFVGETRTQEDCFRAVARALGVEPPSQSVPKPLALSMAIVRRAFANLQGRRPSVYPEYVSTIADDRFFTAAKARRVLGFEPSVTLEEGIKDYLRKKPSSRA